jgi:ribosomal protein S18 acetylase RimI-like enzyme
MAGLIRIRRGEPNDVEAAVDVWRAAGAARRGVATDERSVSAVRGRLIAPDSWFLVAADSGTTVGMACGMDARADDGLGAPIPGLCHLSLVYVAPERWGQGIGGLILDAALDEARVRGYDRIQLWTQETNDRARRLYRSRGFQPTGRTLLDDRNELIGHWRRRL